MGPRRFGIARHTHFAFHTPSLYQEISVFDGRAVGGSGFARASIGDGYLPPYLPFQISPQRHRFSTLALYPTRRKAARRYMPSTLRTPAPHHFLKWPTLRRGEYSLPVTWRADIALTSRFLSILYRRYRLLYSRLRFYYSTPDEILQARLLARPPPRQLMAGDDARRWRGNGIELRTIFIYAESLYTTFRMPIIIDTRKILTSFLMMRHGTGAWLCAQLYASISMLARLAPFHSHISRPPPAALYHYSRWDFTPRR